MAIHDDGSPAGPEVTLDGTVVARGWPAVESVLGAFAAEHLERDVAIHAAIVGIGRCAVVLPGRSGAGKSTLCAAALDAGWWAWSDEYVLVDPADGSVDGWPRPLRLRPSGDGTADAWDRSAIDAVEPPGPVVAAVVAFVEHRPGGGTVLAPLSTADAVSRVVGNAVCARSRPDDALDAALGLCRGATCVAGTRGEAADAVEVLRDLLPPG